jgi:hypothetical protein
MIALSACRIYRERYVDIVIAQARISLSRSQALAAWSRGSIPITNHALYVPLTCLDARVKVDEYILLSCWYVLIYCERYVKGVIAHARISLRSQALAVVAS